MRKIFCLLLISLVSLMLQGTPTDNKDPEIVKIKGGVRDYTGVFPAHVKTIGIITPASYPSVRSANAGIALLRKAGYKVKVFPHAFTRPEGVEKNPYTAIPVELRVKDFEAAWNDKEIDMIICTRGGSGTEALVANINWTKLEKRRDLYLMGYSDVTMLLCAMNAKGYGRPVAGQVLSSLPGLNHAIIPLVKKMFHGEELPPIKLKVLVPGDCSGKMLAGLLSRFVRCVRAKYGMESCGRIIVIECVNSTPEKIRNDLDELLKNNFFKGASGVVFGHFLRSGKKELIDPILKEFATKLKLPVYRNLPFGHNARHMAIDFEREAVIRNNTLRFPAVKK